MSEKENGMTAAAAIMEPLDGNVNRNSKDSVFCELFSRPAYCLQLYQALHPEDTHVTEDDLTLVTLNSLMTQDRYNDLGFLVRDHLLVMVEAQSTFSVNILVRFLLYLAETYNRYINRMNLNIYGSKRITLPLPELYVLYPENRESKPDEIKLSKEIFGLDDASQAFVDVKAKILYDSKQGDIINQYVTFARVFDAQVTTWGYTRKAVDETIRICRDQNVLSSFLAEEEVANIMFTMADQEKAKKFWEEDLRNEGRAEGKIEGRAEGKIEGIEEGLFISVQTLMRSMQMTAKQAMDALCIPADKQAAFAKLL